MFKKCNDQELNSFKMVLIASISNKFAFFSQLPKQRRDVALGSGRLSLLGIVHRSQWSLSTGPSGHCPQVPVVIVHRSQWSLSTGSSGHCQQVPVVIVNRSQWSLSTDPSGHCQQIPVVIVNRSQWSLSTDPSGHCPVIVVFRGRNGKFAAAKFAPFRNLLQILLLFMKNLSFHHFKTEVFFFLSDKVPKVSIAPFFYFPIIVLKLPVCLKLLY